MVTQATPPTDQYEMLQYYMIRGECLNVLERVEKTRLNLVTPAHETFKLGYDVILPLLDNPPTHDLKNFLGYCEAWADSIAGHHDSEGQSLYAFHDIIDSNWTLLDFFIQRRQFSLYSRQKLICPRNANNTRSTLR